jgi:hypothetical protein
MISGTVLLLASLVFAAAVLYASVGHGGASGYLAAMALVGIAPEMMKPTALALNILVATIGTVKFYRAGFFSWRVLWPFALLSVPFAFLGGTLVLTPALYRPLVGAVLLYAAYRLYLQTRSRETEKPAERSVPVWAALAVGAGIGLLSGLTGVGGGIFLSPLLLLAGWSDMRTASGVAAAFILVNSVAGLAGHLSGVASLPDFLLVLAVAAVAGGWIGAELGSRRLAPRPVRYLLVVVLVVAAFKMLAT